MSKTDGVHFPNYAPSRFLILRAGRGDAIIPALTSPTMPRGKLVFGRGAGGKGGGGPPRDSLSPRALRPGWAELTSASWLINGQRGCLQGAGPVPAELRSWPFPRTVCGDTSSLQGLPVEVYQCLYWQRAPRPARPRTADAARVRMRWAGSQALLSQAPASSHLFDLWSCSATLFFPFSFTRNFQA